METRTHQIKIITFVLASIILTRVQFVYAQQSCHVQFNGVSIQGTVILPGDFVSYSIRNPYGNNPQEVRSQVGVLEKVNEAQQSVVISGRIILPSSHLAGGASVIKPGDLLSYKVRNPYGTDISEIRTDVGLFQRIEDQGKSVVISGRIYNVRSQLTEGVQLIQIHDYVHVTLRDGRKLLGLYKGLKDNGRIAIFSENEVLIREIGSIAKIKID